MDFLIDSKMSVDVYAIGYFQRLRNYQNIRLEASHSISVHYIVAHQTYLYDALHC